MATSTATRLKRVFRPYHEWEETHAGMWRRPTGQERTRWITKAAAFMRDTCRFRRAMFCAIREWPVSCSVNLSAGSMNRQAWLGHAAVCIAIKCPEECTRTAWWTLTQRQRDDADKAAAEAILEWERRYYAKDPA